MAKLFDTKKINDNFFALFGAKTPLEIASFVGVGLSAVYSWKRGDKQVPWDKLALAKELSGKSWDWLLGAEAEISSTQTLVANIPPSNAIRRKGDQDAAHHVLHLKSVGDAAALEKGSGLRGIFDDGASFWDEEEIPETTHLVRIRGDSMSPMIMHGQYAMVGPEYLVANGDVPGERAIVIAEIAVQENDIGGVDSELEGVHCKRIQDAGDFWCFTSINPTGASFSTAKDNCRLFIFV